MGRDTTADTKPLLMDAEQNIGNSAIVMPQVGMPLPYSPTVIPQTNPARILQLTGGSARGQTISIVMTASRLVGSQNPNPGFPGPITGIIEFGNGGRFTKVEFDVPIGPFLGTISQAADATEPQDGGVIVTVPTGVLRVYARYDNLLLAPVLGTNAPLSPADLGPGGPIPGIIPTPAEPVQTKAMSAYFSRHFARAYKTLYCYCANPVLPAAIVVGDPAIVPLPGLSFFCLPAFARSVKILRLQRPVTTNELPAMTAYLHNGIRLTDKIDIPAGVSSPDIKVEGNENIIGLVSKTAADAVTFLALSCEIGV
jgi:hypothetical protein